METNEFKMTYYVGVMLAHGGVLMIKEDRLVFSPGTIERAMGASDTVIPFDQVKVVEVSGTITESLLVRTQEKVHRFVGSDLYKIRDKINSSLQNAHQLKSSMVESSARVQTQTAAPVLNTDPVIAASSSPAVALQPLEKAVLQNKCPHCSQTIRPEFNFCPFCQAILKKSCPKCYKSVEMEWKFCPFCKVAVIAQVE